jgi:RHS repeat-associated protein
LNIEISANRNRKVTLNFSGGSSVQIHVKELNLFCGDSLSIKSKDGIEIQRIFKFSDLEDGWSENVIGQNILLEIIPGNWSNCQLYRESNLKVDFISRIHGRHSFKNYKFEIPKNMLQENNMCNVATECPPIWKAKIENLDAISGRICLKNSQDRLSNSLVLKVKDRNGRRTLAELNGPQNSQCTSWLKDDKFLIEVYADKTLYANADSVVGKIEWKYERPHIPHRYPGQEETYLNNKIMYQNWNRWYDPTLGRYLQPDPKIKTIANMVFAPCIEINKMKGIYSSKAFCFQSESINPILSSYVYAGNNPLMNIDRKGRLVEPGIGLIGGTIVTASGYVIAATGIGLAAGAGVIIGSAINELIEDTIQDALTGFLPDDGSLASRGKILPFASPSPSPASASPSSGGGSKRTCSVKGGGSGPNEWCALVAETSMSCGYKCDDGYYFIVPAGPDGDCPNLVLRDPRI